MSQALDHDWLSEPSSQPMESQRIGLGGDSMWSIQSFDSLQPDFDLGYDNGPESIANWQRPATVSGTRLESGVEGSDDFSQPLTKLHLNTPEGGNIPSKTASSKHTATTTTGAVGINTNTPVSPLSPLVAGSHVDIVSPSAPTSASPTFLSKTKSKQKQKRKLGHEKGGKSIDSEDQGLENVIHRTDNVPVNESMDVSGEQAPEPAVVESVKKDGKDGVVPGRRPRKSMRLQ